MSVRHSSVRWSCCFVMILIAARFSSPAAKALIQKNETQIPENAFVLPTFEPAASTARSSVTALLAKTGIPGMSVSVYADGKLLWSEAFGFADLEKKIASSRTTVYRIGSISKLLTVAALAKLYEQGRIDLDAPISKYVPGYADADGKITARRLAGHTAGVRHYSGAGEFLSQSQCTDVVQALDIFKNDPLLFEPGTKYAYSSYGYVLLSAAIQGVSQVPFAEYVRQSVIEPLKMGQTSVESHGLPVAHQSALYNLYGGKVVPGPVMNVSCRVAAGGYLSTADDLARLVSSLVDGSFLKLETVNLMFTSQKLNDGKETEVGIGWRVAKDDTGRRFVHHGGDIVGGRAFVLLYPDTKLALAICSNLGSAPFGQKEAQLISAPFLAHVTGGN